MWKASDVPFFHRKKETTHKGIQGSLRTPSLLKKDKEEEGGNSFFKSEGVRKDPQSTVLGIKWNLLS